jgi:sulfoxide reductase heme-binding subunit YedZ
MVAWLLLTASVIWGIWLSIRRPGTNPRPNWLLDLHRWLGGLAVSFTLVHLVGIALDGFVDFSPTDLLVPFSSEWHPLAVAWGIVALYGLVAVQVTSMMRRRLSKRSWHRVHLTSYVLFWVASAHGILAGTDGGTPVFTVLAVTGMTVVALGTFARIRPGPTTTAPTPSHGH